MYSPRSSWKTCTRAHGDRGNHKQQEEESDLHKDPEPINNQCIFIADVRSNAKKLRGFRNGDQSEGAQIQQQPASKQLEVH